MKTRIVTIRRVSTKKQGSTGLGLEAQQIALDSYISANDVEVVGQFTEVGSGRKKNRPVLDKAIALCKKEKAMLVVAKLDRLGRRVSVISALLESNIEIKFLDFPDSNRLMLHVLASIAEYESSLISSRVKSAISVYQSKGGEWGKHGKHLAKQNKKSAKAFAESIGAHIKEAITRTRKPTYSRIADKLNSNGIKTRTGKKFFPASVRNAMNQLEISF
jgi:DNA invertase Pin-like site-specific DNA recombinase